MKIFAITFLLAGSAAAFTVVQMRNDVSEPGGPGTAPTELTRDVPKERTRERVEPLDFELLRVEPGSMLIAGRAAPNSSVDIIENGDTLATVRTGDTGDFVYTHEGPMRRYILHLRSGKRLSSQVAVVAPGTDGDTLAMITGSNEASEVVQRPFESGTGPLLPVTVEAVEVEASDLFIAGSAPAGETVRVYVDETFAGEVRAGANGRYVARSKRAISPGRYAVRVDLLGSRDEAVIARAEVPLLHRGDADGIVMNDDPSALETGASVIIRPGDSLWRISRRAYGRGTRYTTIFDANRDQIRDPDRIFAGQVFSLPTAPSFVAPSVGNGG